MAEINLGNESNINVDLTTDTPISTNLPDINYIPGYVEAEEQRRTNEEERISNEEEREDLYNEVKTKLQNGELNGRDGVRQYTAGSGIKIENDIISNTRDSVNWGKIEGDISNQTDLKNALDSKADTDDIPTNLSDLTNDENFIDNTVNNLVNYYLKNDLYTKSEVDALISAIQGFKVEIVQTLPVSDIDTHTIYLKSSVDPKTQNVYDEFIYVNNNWEQIGSTAIDLTNYYTKTQVNNLLSNKQDTLVSGTNVKTINDESILGSGNIPIEIPEVYAGTTNPDTSESLQYVKLWIEPSEDSVDAEGTYISNEYGIAQDKGYSQEYVNKLLEYDKTTISTANIVNGTLTNANVDIRLRKDEKTLKLYGQVNYASSYSITQVDIATGLTNLVDVTTTLQNIAIVQDTTDNNVKLVVDGTLNTDGTLSILVNPSTNGHSYKVCFMNNEIEL